MYFLTSPIPMFVFLPNPVHNHIKDCCYKIYLRQQQLNESKDDYDTLPDVNHIPESFKESLKKQKMLYLEMLRQHNL
ncbi:unnamed protein product [Onchocerca flexuosa]|nr:unnamed protein product [Onchocerca flexuosa]